MCALNDQLQGIITVTQQEYLPILAEGFLVDRKAQGLSDKTILFYQKKLKYFLDFCDGQALTQIVQVAPDLLRRFILHLTDTHNPGGVHAIYRTIRAFFHWVEFEGVMLDNWNNPIRRVKAPRVALEPIEPVSIGTVDAMLKVCGDNLAGARDKAILIRKGKGSKPRMVYLGRKSRQALRRYLRHCSDKNPALWVNHPRFGSERLSYESLRVVVRRRASMAGVDRPSLHDFRRAFALSMLRSETDLYTLSRLMGHDGIGVLQRYLKLTYQDTETAHRRAGPVDNSELGW